MDSHADLESHDLDDALDSSEHVIQAFQQNHNSTKENDVIDDLSSSSQQNLTQNDNNEQTHNKSTKRQLTNTVDDDVHEQQPKAKAQKISSSSTTSTISKQPKKETNSNNSTRSVPSPIATNAITAATVSAANGIVTENTNPPTSNNVSTLPIASTLSTAVPYVPFASLQPSHTPLVPPSLVSMPIQVQRRAVPIRPLGVVPLPPHGTIPTTNIIQDLQSRTNPEIMAAAAAAAVAAASLQANIATTTATTNGTILANAPSSNQTLNHSNTHVVGEMAKGKRRGLSTNLIVSNDALTPEERTKQKRMLRNRESAARSRDKKKLKNKELEISIEKHKAKRAIVEKCIVDLSKLVNEMQTVLKKHDIQLPQQDSTLIGKS